MPEIYVIDGIQFKIWDSAIYQMMHGGYIDIVEIT
jgi:hypothetical protein